MAGATGKLLFGALGLVLAVPMLRRVAAPQSDAARATAQVCSNTTARPSGISAL
jgi:hypothetical protein